MANSLRGEVLNLYKNKKYSIFGKVTMTNSSGKEKKPL
uniref:Electron transfer flavoprotein regulatory factor 1 n=1 Tax=Saimiri boliviensis boliviensis TaxID=39432 RepID=A0A2K6TFH3_SAIBB